MNCKLGNVLIKWPDREALQRTMPFCFRVHYGLRVTAIIDCFELFIEKPSSLLAKSCAWSQYYNTAKYLITICQVILSTREFFQVILLGISQFK